MKYKTYSVNIDMTWSEEITVKAKTAREARSKAWAKFKRNPPKKNFSFYEDKVE